MNSDSEKPTSNSTNAGAVRNPKLTQADFSSHKPRQKPSLLVIITAFGLQDRMQNCIYPYGSQ